MRNIILYLFLLFVCSNCKNIEQNIHPHDLFVYYKLDNYSFVTKRSDIIKTYKDMQYDINDEMLFDVLVLQKPIFSSNTTLFVKVILTLIYHYLCQE